MTHCNRTGLSALLIWLLLAALPNSGAQQSAHQEPDSAEITKFRQERDQRLRSSFSPLALVHREYLKNRARVTLGSSPKADIQLEGEDVASLHAVIQGSSATPTLRSIGQSNAWTLDDPPEPVTEVALNDGITFGIGRYNLLYKLHLSWGRIIEVYDSSHPAYREFAGLQFFPVNPAYRVVADVMPYQKPDRINLIDSHGNERPYWVYGELRFNIHGISCRLELYTQTIDPKEIENSQFMLIFADAASGQETYPAARYLYVEGKATGQIMVDFNKAFSPPCAFSPVYTCPFPRPQNRLPVAIRAGEKWYREHFSTGE